MGTAPGGKRVGGSADGGLVLRVPVRPREQLCDEERRRGGLEVRKGLGCGRAGGAGGGVASLATVRAARVI